MDEGWGDDSGWGWFFFMMALVCLFVVIVGSAKQLQSERNQPTEPEVKVVAPENYEFQCIQKNMGLERPVLICWEKQDEI